MNDKKTRADKLRGMTNERCTALEQLRREVLWMCRNEGIYRCKS